MDDKPQAGCYRSLWVVLMDDVKKGFMNELTVNIVIAFLNERVSRGQPEDPI